MIKATAYGSFQELRDGLIHGEPPPAGSWIQLQWPDNTITTHLIYADPPDSNLRMIRLQYHGSEIGALLCMVKVKWARYVDVEIVEDLTE